MTGAPMKLVIEDEAGTKSTVPFTGTEITVGRGAEGITYRLADRNVSRRHARFFLLNGAVFVEDLGSLTGTRVNGDRIAGRKKVRAGDLVQIGDYDLVVQGQTAGAAEKSPPPIPGTSAGMAVGAPASPLRDPALVRLAAAVAVGALVLGGALGWVVGLATR
ncbi:MAG: FHA domain-containing protein [Anaeromyxobacteraceae bacterium]